MMPSGASAEDRRRVQAVVRIRDVRPIVLDLIAVAQRATAIRTVETRIGLQPSADLRAQTIALTKTVLPDLDGPDSEVIIFGTDNACRSLSSNLFARST
jgi:hypothetical protein